MKNSGSFFTELETFLNNLLQRLFPVWYATQAAREIQLEALGSLNPPSFLSHRWLSLHAVVQGLQQSLQAQGSDWLELQELLSKLLVEKEYPRRLSITAIHGVEQSQHDQDWPNLLAYAEQLPEERLIDSAEDFDTRLHEAFPEANKPHRVVYREWDGRYYWINPDEPDQLAALQRYAHEHQRDTAINATISVESLNSKVLDRIRNDWWLLLLKRDSAYLLHNLMSQGNLPVALGEFEWRRSDLVFLIARKSNRSINRIILNLLNNHPSQEALEFGRFLSRQHFPFRNQ